MNPVGADIDIATFVAYHRTTDRNKIDTLAEANYTALQGNGLVNE